VQIKVVFLDSNGNIKGIGEFCGFASESSQHKNEIRFLNIEAEHD